MAVKPCVCIPLLFLIFIYYFEKVLWGFGYNMASWIHVSFVYNKAS